MRSRVRDAMSGTRRKSLPAESTSCNLQPPPCPAPLHSTRSSRQLRSPPVGLCRLRPLPSATRWSGSTSWSTVTSQPPSPPYSFLTPTRWSRCCSPLDRLACLILARPFGAVILGAYADRAGRKAALALSIRLMVIGTAVLALMPSYASIGLIAPIAVFAARLLQGFAVAGEFGSSTAFMIEHSANRKAFFSSWQFAGQQMAKFLAALFGLGLSTRN